MGESGYANSSWSASAGYSASMLTEDAKVDSSSTRQLLPSSVNISAEYPALPDHDSMNNPSILTNGSISLTITICAAETYLYNTRTSKKVNWAIWHIDSIL